MSKVYAKLLLFGCMMLLARMVIAQNVSNVSVVQVGKSIEITYDLDVAADISVYLSTNGGTTYRGLRQVSGDVGKTVGPGHKTIVWDVLSEMEELIGDSIVFMVRVDANAEAEWNKILRKEARKSVPYNTFVTLNAAYSPYPHPHWSVGFKVGQMKNVGWFVSMMSNFHFRGLGNPFKEGVDYWLTSCKTTRFSAQAGLVVRPCKPMSLLFGVGYGYLSLTYKDIDDVWYSYPKWTYSGVDASFGFLFDIKGVVLSAEAVTTNFKTIETRVGVGYRFPDKKREKKQTVKVLK